LSGCSSVTGLTSFSSGVDALQFSGDGEELKARRNDSAYLMALFWIVMQLRSSSLQGGG
jgi:hypothetical protein